MKKTHILFFACLFFPYLSWGQNYDSIFLRINQEQIVKQDLVLPNKIGKKVYRHWFLSKELPTRNLLMNLAAICEVNASKKWGKWFAHLSLERYLYLKSISPAGYPGDIYAVSHSLSFTPLRKKTKRQIKKLCLGRKSIPHQTDFSLIFSKIKSEKCLIIIKDKIYLDLQDPEKEWSVEEIRDLGILVKNGDSFAKEKLSQVFEEIVGKRSNEYLLKETVGELAAIGGKEISDMIIDKLLFSDNEFKDVDFSRSDFWLAIHTLSSLVIEFQDPSIWDFYSEDEALMKKRVRE